MFTGIIKEVGKVLEISGTNEKKLTISTKKIHQDQKKGDSISINGACLTVTSNKNGNLEFDIITETLEKTNLGKLQTGSPVNMETALKINDGIHGHLIQGHVDTTAEVIQPPTKENKQTLTINFPPHISKHLALKGSITINGVSLTISKLEKNTFSVSLIPETLTETNLGLVKKGDIVNLEVDLISRYLERLINEKEDQSNYRFLFDRGFI